MSSYIIDPKPKVPSAIQSSPEYQSWLKKAFPLPSSSSSSSSNINNSSSTNFKNNKTVDNSNNQNALMIIPASSNNQQQQKQETKESISQQQRDLKSFALNSGSSVIVNEKAFAGNDSSDDNNDVNTAVAQRSVTVDDFNAAFYKKKQEILRIQKEKIAKREQDEKKKKEQEDKFETTNSDLQQSAPQRRSQREEDTDDRNVDNNQQSKAAQQQSSNNTSSLLPAGSGIFAPPDHLGRSFLHCPQSLSSHDIKRSKLLPENNNNSSSIKLPMKLSHAYKTNSTAAITSLAFLPPFGHLAISGDITGICCMFEVISSSANTDQDVSTGTQKVRTEKLAQYSGFHKLGVRDISFPAADASRAGASSSGTLNSASNEKFLSCSIDHEHPLALWDTERAQIVSEYHLSEKWYSKFVRDAGCSAVSFVPPGVHSGATRGDTLCASAFGKAIVIWDTRSASRVIDLEAHHAPVSHLRFVQYGRGLFSCGEDKTLRLWDLRSTAAVQEFSHAQMHSITNTIEHPWTGEVLAQSNDNRIRCLTRLNKSKTIRNIPFNHGQLSSATSEYAFARGDANNSSSISSAKSGREFTGHAISGTTCKIGLSRTDGGRVVSSGDVFGNLWMWNYDLSNNNNNKKSSEEEAAAAPGLLRKFRAHGKELTVHDWHPVVPGMILTGGKDGQLRCFK